MINILGISVYEIDVVITNLILFVESLLFVYLLWKQSTRSTLLKKLFIILFLSLAASSLLGSIFHAFFPLKATTTGGLALWTLVAASIGITASTILCISALIIKGKNLLKIVTPFAIILLAALVYRVIFINYEFITIIMFYLPPMIIFTFVSLGMYIRHRTKAWVYLSSGLILSFIAAAIQYLQIGIHPMYFNHNALYHVIQGIALALIFLGGRFLLRGNSSNKF